MSRVRRGALVLALLLLAWPVVAPTIQAHGVLVRADPPDACSVSSVPRPVPHDPRCSSGIVLSVPPTSVTLWFSEPVEPFAGGIRVIAPSGARVERGRATASGVSMSVPVEAMEMGTYRVRWAVVATDTHPSRGGYTFSVGSPSDAPPDDNRPPSGVGLALQAFGRWLHMGGFALVAGVSVFGLLVVRLNGMAAIAGVERRLRALVALGIVVLLLAEPPTLLGQALSLTSSRLPTADDLADLLSSPSGRATALRLGAALLTWVATGVVTSITGRGTVALVAIAVVLALLDSHAGHPATNSAPWLATPLMALHTLAMAAWAGGLIALLRLWRLPISDGQRAGLVRRMGSVAAAALCVLLLSGAALAPLLAGVPSGLPSSGYARTLVTKIALLLVAGLCAASAIRRRPAFAPRWWRAEAVALAAVVALAGLLASLPPDWD